MRASETGGVLATKSERKMLGSTCLYSFYAWFLLATFLHQSVAVSGDGNAPHVYLSSGPGGRGGYWAIDERGRYVWYHYVGPGRFQKDETTAIDVEEARRSHYRQVNDSRRLTDELRRRPGRERFFDRRRYGPHGWRRRRPRVSVILVDFIS